MRGEGKLGAMVLYIVSRCGCNRNFGRVMLCRLCYFSDFGSYELRGESVSGSDYVLANGGPEPAGIDDLLVDLVRRKLLRVSFRHGSVSYALQSTPDLSPLTSGDISVLDHAISAYGGMNERILSWMSREDAPCAGRTPSEVLVSGTSGRPPSAGPEGSSVESMTSRTMRRTSSMPYVR